MSEHRVEISWSGGDREFTYETYAREHQWSFDDGTPEVRVSAAPAYKGEPDALDPEQAFVGSLSSCHMLTFLALAAKKKWVVESYRDEAVGELGRNADGKMAMTIVRLRPQIEFGGEAPSTEAIEAVHEKAHEYCFIANSVSTEVVVESE